MELTIFLAQVLGIYFLVAGVGGLLNPDRMRKAMEEMRTSYLLPYFDGALALILGLLLVLSHNIWEDLLTSLITLVGWIALVEGVLMLLLPQQSLTKLMERFGSHRIAVPLAVIAVVLGIYFVFQGFFA